MNECRCCGSPIEDDKEHCKECENALRNKQNLRTVLLTQLLLKHRIRAEAMNRVLNRV